MLIRTVASLLILCCCLNAVSGFGDEQPDDARRTVRMGPLVLREFGTISATGTQRRTDMGLASHVTFECETADAASKLASKYLADVLAYGPVEIVPAPSSANATSFAVMSSGRWLIAVDRQRVQVLYGENVKALNEALQLTNMTAWRPVMPHIYPRYLDNFDNSSLGIWWMSPTKSEDVLKFAHEYPLVLNIHPHQTIASGFAPNVFDTTGPENTIAQAKEIGKPFRFMIWGGLPRWWEDDNDLTEAAEWVSDGALPGPTLFHADGYYATQVASPIANIIQLDALKQVMDRFKDDPDLLGWLEPHGEFMLFDPLRNPPHARERFTRYLADQKQLSLAEANERFGFEAASWDDFPYPETAFFAGRRGTYLDLDDVKWRWLPGVLLDEGARLGFADVGFDASSWAEAYRTSRRLLNIYQADGNAAPLWYTFSHEVPESFLREGQRVIFHALPYTQREGKPLYLWVNGHEVSMLSMSSGYMNRHTQFDVTEYIRPGDNHFAIYSHGGRILDRVFLSHVPGEEFPYSDRRLSQLWLDLNDYLVWEKFETLELYLKWMRSIDPVRPIKVMTPHMFQSDAFDLFERFGAYPQLTGEGGWYRPMHYKGYARLRGLPASSEGGNACRTDRAMQQMTANLFWENQDCHDYVFDIARDFWSKPDVVQWWKDNEPLMKTLGKFDFDQAKVGVLRDVEQAERYQNGDIWNWDLSRGILPSAGITPVLIDGKDMDKGLANSVPVVFDCATSVMTPERIESIKQYVRNGGVFVAQFNTGRHSPLEADSWPLAAAFGLKVEDYKIDGGGRDHWPIAEIRFSKTQELLAALRGKTIEASGVSIDHIGNESTGAISIAGEGASIEPIATWDNGTMAVCKMKLGQGELVWIGTPFHIRMKDSGGKWLNREDRQALFTDLLAGLGVFPDVTSTNPDVWVERRLSKNGMFNVFIADAINVGSDWNLEDTIQSDLLLHGVEAKQLIDVTRVGGEVVIGQSSQGDTRLKDQVFHPYEVRQYLAIRDDVGLDGPLHWLSMMQRQWRALDPVEGLPKDTHIQVTAEAARLGEDGLPLNQGWWVRRSSGSPLPQDAWTEAGFDSSSWETGDLGTWRVNGWSGITQAQYLKTVFVPDAWLASGGRVLLGFNSGFEQMGIKDQASFWVNGVQIGRDLKQPFLEDVTDKLADGALMLAIDVHGGARDGGLAGVLYLRLVPRSMASLDLSGSWTAMKSLNEVSDAVTLPGPTQGMFGLTRSFELPPDWNGKHVRLVIEQGENTTAVEGVLLNTTGYFREEVDGLSPYGVRVDHLLKPGTNEIDLYGPKHSSNREYFSINRPTMHGNVLGIRLELYEDQ